MINAWEGIAYWTEAQGAQGPLWVLQGKGKPPQALEKLLQSMFTLMFTRMFHMYV